MADELNWCFRIDISEILKRSRTPQNIKRIPKLKTNKLYMNVPPAKTTPTSPTLLLQLTTYKKTAKP